MAIAETPAYVQERAEDYALVERETGAVLSTHDTLRRALDGALGLAAFGRKLDADLRAKSPVLHDVKTGLPNGAYRWLDASAEELEPLDDGSQVTPGRIRSMARNLTAANQPIPLDGGVIPGQLPSGPHDQLFDSGTPSRGWAHVGAEWREMPSDEWPDGRVHLAFYAELLPVVARAMDSGELAFGSIGFKHSKNSDEATALQHALTNMPVVTGLLPSSAMRTESPTDHLFARGAARRLLMSDKTKTAARGPATDLLKSLYAKLNITEEAAQKNFYDEVYSKLRALADHSSVEGMLEGAAPETTAALSQDGAARSAAVVALGARMVAQSAEVTLVAGRATLASDLDKRITAFAKDLGVDAAIVKSAVLKAIASQMGASDAPAAEEPEAEKSKPPAEKLKGDDDEKPEDKPVGKSADAAATPRAIPGLESPEALEAFAADALAVLRAIFGDEGMAPPAALDALKAAQDGIKGMLAGGAGVPPEGAPGDMPAGRAADFVSLRSQLATLQALRASDATKIATLEAGVERARLTVEVGRAFVDGGRVASEKAIDETVELILGTSVSMRARVRDLAVKAAPPAGEAMPDEKRDTTPGEGAFANLDAAVEHYVSVVRAEAPKLSAADVSAAAYARARAAHPRLS